MNTVHDELRDVYVNIKLAILICQTNPECEHSCFHCILYQCNKKLNPFSAQDCIDNTHCQIKPHFTLNYCICFLFCVCVLVVFVSQASFDTILGLVI